METLTTAKDLSNQKDKFSQKMLDELKTKEIALETSLNSKVFDVAIINTNVEALKRYLYELLAYANNKEAALKAIDNSQVDGNSVTNKDERNGDKTRTISN